MALASPAGAYYNPGNPVGFVNDYASVLSQEQKATLENKISAYQKSTTNEIAVAVILSLQDDTIENFAVKLFEDWGIGSKEKDNGVLILVAIEDRKMRIETGYGVEGYLTDAQASWIINDIMKPAFRNNDYYFGVNGAVDKIMAALGGEELPSASKTNNSAATDLLFSFIWFGGFFIVILASILGRSKSWWVGGIVGAVFGLIIGAFLGGANSSLIWASILTPLGFLFDYVVSKQYQVSKKTGHYPWWIGGSGRSGGSGGGFGGFGGGHSGGGGSSGSW